MEDSDRESRTESLPPKTPKTPKTPSRVRWTPDVQGRYRLGVGEREAGRSGHGGRSEFIAEEMEPSERMPSSLIGSSLGSFDAAPSGDSVAKKSKLGGSLRRDKQGGGGMLPSIAASASVAQIKRPLFTAFPGNSVVQKPPLLAKMEGIIKASGRFNTDGVPGEPSRARLDVMRVVFALYCDSAKIYKPILGMIQREYEEHVLMYDEMRNRQSTLEDDLETGGDFFTQQTNEMKKRWKERLRKANEAVNEWKTLHSILNKSEREAVELCRRQQESVDLMEKKVEEAEKDVAHVSADNDRLAKECNRLAYDAERTAQVEREKNRLEEQLDHLTAQVAQMKTDMEVQQVRVNTQLRDYDQVKRNAERMARRVEQLEGEMKQLTPRPDWPEVVRGCDVAADADDTTVRMVDRLKQFLPLKPPDEGEGGEGEGLASPPKLKRAPSKAGMIKRQGSTASTRSDDKEEKPRRKKSVSKQTSGKSLLEDAADGGDKDEKPKRKKSVVSKQTSGKSLLDDAADAGDDGGQ